MQQGLKKINEDEVYMFRVNEAQHHDFNVAGVVGVVCFITGVVCFVIGIMIGVMI